MLCMLTLYFTTWSSITDLETLCIAGHRAGHKFLCICQFTLITNGHLAANNSERPAIYCVRKEIRNWNVYSFFTCFFSLESGILNSTAVRGHDCHPEAVQNLKRIKLGMCMLYITCTVIFPSRCALDGHCMAPLGDTRPCECGLFIRDVCQLNFLPVC